MASHSTSPVDYPDVYGPVPGGRPLTGTVTPPGSKSITQRYFNLALIARRRLEIQRPLLSDDTRFFLGALESAGFKVEIGGESVLVEPTEIENSADQDREIEVFCGAGGTMLRFLTAALTVVPGRWRLDGIQRLRERPVGPLVDALRNLGARITCDGPDGYAPMHLDGASLRGGTTRLDAGASSQFLSALLMAGLVAPEELVVEVDALTSEPYVDLTLDAVQEMGGEIVREGSVFRVLPVTGEMPERVRVEADFSAVAYPAAGSLLTGGEVTIDGVRESSRQGDRGFLEVLEAMGAELEWRSGDLTDQLIVRGGALRAVDVDLEAMPDQVPTLAALAPFAEGTTRIRNVPNLRLKESDRLAAMTEELRRVGAEVEELADGLVIPGVWAKETPPSEAVVCNSHGDHRIAMAMAIVGLRRPGLSVEAPEVVAKSYPMFWRDLEDLTRR